MKFLLSLILVVGLWGGAQKSESDLPLVAPEIMGKIYVMVEMIDQALEKQKVPCWIGGGTLLGAMRNKGLIPWEASAHLEFFINDQQRIKKALSMFNEDGFVFEYDEKEHVYTFHKEGVGEPVVYLYGVMFNKRVKNYGTAQKHPWGPSHWNIQELASFKRLMLGPIEVNVPNGVYYYIKRRYGIGSFETAIVKIDGIYYKIPLTKKHIATFTIPLEWKPLLKMS